jgi:hypothetical protein
MQGRVGVSPTTTAHALNQIFFFCLGEKEVNNEPVDNK